jgi:hypothetical protein
MSKGRSIWVVAFLVIALGMSWAQSDSGQQPADSGQSSGAPPAPAFGQDNPPPQSSDNPPISGLDQPSLEPRAASRSFLIPGAHISQALDTSITGLKGDVSLHGVTRVLGSLTLQKLWSRYDMALDYVGGGAFYSNRAVDAAQLQQLDVDQRILWKTGQLAIRDSFSYMPEGAFGYGSYGGSGALGGIGNPGGGLASGGGTLFGPGQFATLGQDPHLTNVTVADITEALTPRSSVTLAGSYGLVHFTGGNLDNLIDSRQVTTHAGYNYQLNRKDQIAVVYGFQAFRYPGRSGSSFDTQVGNVLYGHRISGRMDLVIGGGPQLTQITSLSGPTSSPSTSSRLSMSGRASLRYRFAVTSVGLHYNHYNTSGSGFFAGASSDVARFTVTRPFGRRWTANWDVGYTHNDRIGAVVFSSFAVGAAQTYDYLYAGGGLHRQLGRNLSAYVSYQFNHLEFDSTFCTGILGPCNRASQRHVAIVGLDWHPRAIRLD